MLDRNTTQIEISASRSNRNWRAIRIKAYEILGERKFHISSEPIRYKETYGDYLQRVDADGAETNRTSGNRWTEDELDSLAQAIENRATRLEMATVLPSLKLVTDCR